MGWLRLAGLNSALIERGQLDVRRHDGVGARRDAGAKRRQLDAIEAVARLRDDRQTEVRVDVGVAVAGKVLERGQHAAGVQAAHVGGRQLADRVRLLAEDARVDHRVARVVVDVGERREVRRARRSPAPRCAVMRAASNASCSSPAAPTAICRGKTVAPAMPEADAGLEVGGVQQRQRRQRLQPVQDRRGRERLAENHGAVVRIEQHVGRALGAAEDVKAADVQVR